MAHRKLCAVKNFCHLPSVCDCVCVRVWCVWLCVWVWMCVSRQFVESRPAKILLGVVHTPAHCVCTGQSRSTVLLAILLIFPFMIHNSVSLLVAFQLSILWKIKRPVWLCLYILFPLILRFISWIVLVSHCWLSQQPRVILSLEASRAHYWSRFPRDGHVVVTSLWDLWFPYKCAPWQFCCAHNYESMTLVAKLYFLVQGK